MKLALVHYNRMNALKQPKTKKIIKTMHQTHQNSDDARLTMCFDLECADSKRECDCTCTYRMTDMLLQLHFIAIHILDFCLRVVFFIIVIITIKFLLLLLNQNIVKE